jgi:hypothetical protein
MIPVLLLWTAAESWFWPTLDKSLDFYVCVSNRRRLTPQIVDVGQTQISNPRFECSRCPRPFLCYRTKLLGYVFTMLFGVKIYQHGSDLPNLMCCWWKLRKRKQFYRVITLLTYQVSRNLIFTRFRKIAKGDQNLRHVCPSVIPSAWNNSASTGRIFTRFDSCVFFVNLSTKYKFD